MEELDVSERILKTAKELFLRFGIRSISMDDIAGHVGISKKTIYQHFKDKDDIVKMAIRRFLAAQMRTLTGIREEAADAVEALVRVHDAVVQNLHEATPTLLHDLQKYHPGAWKEVEEYRKDFLAKLLTEIIHSGVEEGVFNENLRLDILVRLRLEEQMLVNSEDVFPANRFDRTEVICEMLEHFTLAIATARGRRRFKKHISESKVRQK